MEGELFLFEVLVDAITFEESIREIPPKKQIVVTVKLGSLVTLEIRSETLPLAAESSKRRNIDLKSGKSYLCFMMAPALIELLEKDRIEITVGTRGSLQPIGGSVASWDPCFKEMVRTCLEATDFVSPVTTFEHFCLLDNGAIKGSIDIFLKLSCFANNIQTQFELLQEGDTKKFLFKVPNTATTFMCSKFGTGTSLDFTPIAPIMNADNIRLETHDKPRASVSWTTVLGHSSNFTVNRKNSQQSECLYPEFQTAGHGQIKTSVMTFDIQSIRIRPDEEKFMDFFTGKKWGDWDIQTMSLIAGENNKKKQAFLNDEKNYPYNDKTEYGYLNENKVQYNTIPCFERMPLRLRGGGTPGEENEIKLSGLTGGNLPKSPVAECQEIMEQFDKILEAYRMALAPCGQIGCNYVPNITEATCKTACGILPEPTNASGCGLPECEYVKYKKALMIMDADIETQFIGPAILGNCGHPKCSYRADPVLPPIHWECPEPLPIDKCKNPNCPYRFSGNCNETRISSTKGPCGSDQCPYALPAPCDSPNCPFLAPPPCVYLKKEEKEKSQKESRPKNGNNKASEGCPFANPSPIVNIMEICGNPECEFLQQITNSDCETRTEICANPTCPFVNKSQAEKSEPPSTKATRQKKSITVCPNADCPFGKEATEAKVCSNESCPFNITSPSISSPCSNTSDMSACMNPSCPFQKPEEPKKESCANPDCPFNKASVESCQNPDCPFKTKTSSQSSNSSCDNPYCPFKKNSLDSECECDNPKCPSKRDTCPNPNCPFNLRGYEPCGNPNCPYKTYAAGKELDFCATPAASFNEYCQEKTCRYHDPKRDQEGVIPGLDKINLDQHTSLQYASSERQSQYDMAPCSFKTCTFLGGTLKCVDCGVGPEGRRRGPCPKTCPGDPVCPRAVALKMRKPLRTPGFKRICGKLRKRAKLSSEVSKTGKANKLDAIEYPGFKIGHRECVMPYFYVPSNMGWLWNIHTPCLKLQPRRGWRPGAVSRSVARVIMKHRKECNQDNQNEPFNKKKKKDDSERIRPKPTLEIKKREGQYFITMNPLKDPNKLAMNENPYMDCTPMQYKVERTNRLDPDVVCGDEGELYKSDSSSDDELDIEVTTPAGIIHLDRPPLGSKVVKVQETQYNAKDCASKKNAKGKGGGKGDGGKNKDKGKDADKGKDKEKGKDKGKKK